MLLFLFVALENEIGDIWVVAVKSARLTPIPFCGCPRNFLVIRFVYLVRFGCAAIAATTVACCVTSAARLGCDAGVFTSCWSRAVFWSTNAFRSGGRGSLS